MIFDLNAIEQHTGVKITGAIHVGAFLGEELSELLIFFKSAMDASLGIPCLAESPLSSGFFPSLKFSANSRKDNITT